MELGVSLGQSQQQHLLLLPKMLQAIEILQLSTLDLVAMIDRELAENETLELGNSSSDETPDPAPEDPRRHDELEEFPASRAARDEERNDFFAQIPAHSVSLHAHLLGQIAMLDLDDALREVVSFLIGSLDGNGHLQLERDELTAFFDEGAPIDEAIAILRSLEPAGVGGSGPTDSMLAQLDPADPDHEYLVAILVEHLDDLAKNRFPAVARRLGVSIPDLRALTEKLRDLDPCPGRAFGDDDRARIEPDVIVKREDGEWQIYVDDARVPPLTIRDDYMELASDRAAPKSVRTYLKRKLGSAQDLLAAIAQRKETLGRVARATLERQAGFLERGLAGLVPLKMQEVADAVGVHLSTVSRAVAEKHVQTDVGVFALRDLFDGGRGVGADAAGEGGESRVSVQDRIRRLVEAEDGAQPLSDDALVAALETEGVRVARRTVAKYRKELGIPSSWRRRVY